MKLECGRLTLDLSEPRIMGVLNLTPDSFYDGGSLYHSNGVQIDRVLSRAQAMLEEGADIIDLGGESTRPGAEPVSVQQEMDRVLPAVERLHDALGCLISVDTSSPELMREAAQKGAGMINDVRALSREGALAAASSTHLPVCLMHMSGSPQTMQCRPAYDNVIEEVSVYLQERVHVSLAAGIAREKIILDPGFGFGKTDEHNLALLNGLSSLLEQGFPILVGLSRKSMIGRLLGRDLDARLPGSLMLAVAALHGGAKLLRVHDVAATRDVLALYRLTLGRTNQETQ